LKEVFVGNLKMDFTGNQIVQWI